MAQTLVHSTFEGCKELKSPLEGPTIETTGEWDGAPLEELELTLDGATLVKVSKRPGLDGFLAALSQRKGADGFRVVPFTAAAMVWADSHGLPR